MHILRSNILCTQVMVPGGFIFCIQFRKIVQVVILLDKRIQFMSAEVPRNIPQEL